MVSFRKPKILQSKQESLKIILFAQKKNMLAYAYM